MMLSSIWLRQMDPAISNYWKYFKFNEQKTSNKGIYLIFRASNNSLRNIRLFYNCVLRLTAFQPLSDSDPLAKIQKSKPKINVLQFIFKFCTYCCFTRLINAHLCYMRGTLKCVSVIRPVPAGLLVLLVSCALEEGAGLWTSNRFRTLLFTRTLVNLRDYKLKKNELESYKIQNKRQIQDAVYAPREIWLNSKKMTFSWGRTTKFTFRFKFIK